MKGGLLQEIQKPTAETIGFKYDRNGNVTAIVDSLGHEKKYSYDGLDRVVEIIDEIGGVKKFEYDAVGNITKLTDANGNTTQYAYSLLNDLVKVIDPLGNVTNYEYDLNSQMTKIEQISLIDPSLAQVEDAKTLTTHYKYDGNGNVTEIIESADRITQYEYDGDGNVSLKREADGTEILYEYNLLNNLTKIFYEEKKQVELSYDKTQRIVEMKDWLGITKIESDSLGQVTKIEDFASNIIEYDWDSNGNRTRVGYPDGSEVLYNYTAAGNIESVVSALGKTEYKYDANDSLLETILPNGYATSYNKDASGKITELLNVNAQKEVIDKITYEYDAVGNILQMNKKRKDCKVDNGIFEFTYDALNRLSSTKEDEAEKHYSYDAFGNRTQMKTLAGIVEYEYDQFNQLISMADSSNKKEYSYDKRGNLHKVTQNGETYAQYYFDASNMMTKAVMKNGKEIDYTYNGLKKRVSKQIHGFSVEENNPQDKVTYITDITRTFNDVLTVEGKEKVSHNYVWGNDLIASTSGESTYYLQDHLRSPMRLISSDSAQADCGMAYNEFGGIIGDAPQVDTIFGFTGYQQDENELYYAQNRYYSQEVGGFVSKDPVKGVVTSPYSLNGYSYAFNRPTAMVDLDGAWPSFVINAWESVTNFWNTNVYGQSMVVETFKADYNQYDGGVVYGEGINQETIQDKDHTGKILTNTTIVHANGVAETKLALNIPEIRIGTEKFGITLGGNIGISYDTKGKTGVFANTSAKAKIGDYYYKIDPSVSLDNVDGSNIGLKSQCGNGSQSTGIGFAMPSNPWSKAKVFLFSEMQDAEDANNKTKTEVGVKWSQGITYAVVAAIYFAPVLLGAAKGLAPVIVGVVKSYVPGIAGVLTAIWSFLQPYFDKVATSCK